MGIFKKIFGKEKKNEQRVDANDVSSSKSSAEDSRTKRNAPADKAIQISSDRSVKISSSTYLNVPDEKVSGADKSSAKSSNTAQRSKAKATQKNSSTAPRGEKKDIKADTGTDKVEKIPYEGYFDIKKSRDDRYVFNLYAANHVIIASSQVYSSVSATQNGIESVRENARKAPIEDQTKKDFESLPYPKWEMYEDGGGRFRFRLCASNGSCICHSQGYTKKTSCQKGIESIKKFAPTAQIKKSYLKKNT